MKKYIIRFLLIFIAGAVITSCKKITDDINVNPNQPAQVSTGYMFTSALQFLGGTGGVSQMDDNAGLSSHVSIFTKSADYRVIDLENSDKVEGDVHIGKNSIIGSGSKIMPCITIGDNVSVGCNCVIGKNIEGGSIIVSKSLALVTLDRRVK